MKATIDIKTGNLFAQVDDNRHITFHNFTLREAQEFLDKRPVAESKDRINELRQREEDCDGK